MIGAVGELCQLRAGELWIDCRVIDVKASWGKQRLQVAPVAGDGAQWVELSSVRPLAASPVMAGYEADWETARHRAIVESVREGQRKCLAGER
jgi:hypothetical protein